MSSLHKIWFAAVSVLALAGCDAGSIGRSAAERINEARPARPETLQARRALEETFGDELQRELATRDQVRALTCAKGYSPSFYHSKETVASNLPDQKCFDDFDRETVEWLKRKRLHSLLTAGPLREAPSKPVSVFATSGSVGAIKFAEQAPIAVIISNRTVEVLDAGSGDSIFLDRQLSQPPSSVAISANGRVFSVGGRDGVSLRDSESGEVLFELPDHQRFSWLDAETGLAIKRGPGSTDLIDFANEGEAVPIRGVDTTPTRVMTLPGEPQQFLLSSYRSLLKYSWQRSAAGVEATLQDHKAGLPISWSENVGEATIDGAWFVHAANDLWLTNLQTLETEQIPLTPFRGRTVGPTLNPDEVLLFPSSRDSRPLVFSISNRTFAPVEDERLSAQSGYSALRAAFIPSLDRIAVITGSKVLIIEDVQRGPRYGLEALTQMLAEERRAQQEKNARAIAEREGFQLDRIVDGVPVASGPLLAAAEGARIDAVGVYESKSGSHGFGKPSIPGPVMVTLQRSPQPIVLVLSSYEPVVWRISGAGSANLKAVLLSGYSSSTVTGAGGVQVIDIGKHYAYERGGSGYAALQREVIKRTGKGIETFQGKYSGTVFTVGGR